MNFYVYLLYRLLLKIYKNTLVKKIQKNKICISISISILFAVVVYLLICQLSLILKTCWPEKYQDLLIVETVWPISLHNIYVNLRLIIVMLLC